MNISVIGLGKLGASIAGAMASRGFNVIGVDVVPEVVAAVNAGRSPVTEPGLGDLIAANRERISASTDVESAVLASDITFIFVPTPSEPNGAFSLRFATDAVATVGRALASKDSYHLVVMSSTVMPGSSEASLIPTLEASSGKHIGPDFGFCYSPEFIALGSVVRDFLNPDFVLVGEANTRSGDLLQSFYEKLLPAKAPIARMTCSNAELAKIAVNTYVTMKISFANTLAELCQRLPGGDVDQVTTALGLDSRIGRRYLTGALGYGGPCFPRDNVALAQFARSMGIEPTLAEGTDAVNRRRSEEIITLISGEIEPQDTVAILGLSYKPGTDVVDESQGIYLANALARRGHKVVVHDPMALDLARKQLGDIATYATTLEDAVADAAAVIIANPDNFYAALPQSLPARPMLVVDCWRLLKGKPLDGRNIRYRAVGLAPAEANS